MIKLLLVDDHELVRSGLTTIINSDKDIQVINECGDGEEAIQYLEKNAKKGKFSFEDLTRNLTNRKDFQRNLMLKQFYLNHFYQL